MPEDSAGVTKALRMLSEISRKRVAFISAYEYIKTNMHISKVIKSAKLKAHAA
jgi:hypothetical protein